MTKKRKKKEAKEIDLKDIKTVKFNINISVSKEEFDELLRVMTCRINDPEQATEIKEDEKPKKDKD